MGDCTASVTLLSIPAVIQLAPHQVGCGVQMKRVCENTAGLWVQQAYLQTSQEPHESHFQTDSLEDKGRTAFKFQGALIPAQLG